MSRTACHDPRGVPVTLDRPLPYAVVDRHLTDPPPGVRRLDDGLRRIARASILQVETQQRRAPRCPHRPEIVQPDPGPGGQPCRQGSVGHPEVPGLGAALHRPTGPDHQVEAALADGIQNPAQLRRIAGCRRRPSPRRCRRRAASRPAWQAAP